jgi:alpha-glucosidase
VSEIINAHAWWQHGVVYQIYPRSFQDTNGDGTGDLPGIVMRLGHLVELGVQALWISPIYPSPMADFGYDVSDYCGIDPAFGTLDDFDHLVAAAHERGLKVILDYVPNHSSDQHPWFIESRSSRNNPKRDWYIWRDPRPDGSPPNNWLSEFGGPAWTFDQATGQYYYHAYLREQPDLNWRNPDVREVMLDALRFWFERGVDGFRVDAIHQLIEDAALRDNPPDPEWQEGMSPARRVIRAHSMDQPEVHDAIRAMREVADRYDDRVLIGEDLSGFHLPFNFHLLSTPWKPADIAALIDRYEAALPRGAWPNWVLGNHDRSRVASRIGPDQARVAAMLLLTLRGTPTIYQGEEIGMVDVPIPPELLQDPWEKNVPGLGLGRDPVRTPLPWSDAANGDFTRGAPWLPLGEHPAGLNVAAQKGDPNSMLALYRALLQLRRAEPALSVGEYVPVAATESILAYERRIRTRRLLVALNLTPELAGKELAQLNGRLLLSTDAHKPGEVRPVQALGPNEGRIFEIS